MYKYELLAHVDLPFQDDSTFIMALIFLGLGLLFAGVFSRFKIFALLSVGIWFHLAQVFVDDKIIAISMVGLILFSVYVTFAVSNNE